MHSRLLRCLRPALVGAAGGLRVVDVADPLRPAEVSVAGVPPAPQGVAAVARRIREKRCAASCSRRATCVLLDEANRRQDHYVPSKVQSVASAGQDDQTGTRDRLVQRQGVPRGGCVTVRLMVDDDHELVERA